MSKRKTESELTKADEALIFACADGDVARVKAALSAGATIDRDGSQLPLVEAARHGHVGLFRWLLDHGADVLKAEANGDTALFEAARNGHVAIIDPCLGAGDSLERQDKSGHTPLMQAVYFGAAGFVKHLLARGADPNATPQRGTTLKGTTALHLVGSMFEPAYASSAAAEILEALRGAGADAMKRNEHGETILHVAARNAPVPVALLESLLALGVPVDDRDAWGCTPLWHAARVNALAHVILLLSQGADPNARSTETSSFAKAGTSVYEAARERADLKVLSVLRDAGASTPEPLALAAGVGAHVTHAKFGAGDVVASAGAGAERKLTVRFADGTRVLLAKFLSTS